MRLRKNRLTQMYLYNRSVVKDREGGTSEVFSESGLLLDGEWWPASGKLQAELYGQRLPYIRNVRLNELYEACVDEHNKVFYRLPQRDAVIREGDRIGLEADAPQYQIVSIRPDRFLRLEAEAVVK